MTESMPFIILALILSGIAAGIWLHVFQLRREKRDAQRKAALVSLADAAESERKLRAARMQ